MKRHTSPCGRIWTTDNLANKSNNKAIIAAHYVPLLFAVKIFDVVFVVRLPNRKETPNKFIIMFFL